ncbi:uncharacterized protein HaLaN_13468, partial [Haematococcus lacustris]
MSTGEGSLVSVVGHNIFKVFKYSDGAMKALNPALGKRDPGSITCQLWVLGDVSDPKERLLLGTMDGEVLMLENGTDARAVFNCDNGLAVHSLAAYSKGFVAGQEGGVVTIFEKDDKELYRRARAFSIESNPVKVKYMAISPNEEHLVCSLENGQIMKADEMNFDVMGTSNHQGPVTGTGQQQLPNPTRHRQVWLCHCPDAGMDICVRKPLLVTCSTDKSIRFWNYVDRTCELTKWFPDEIFSVAIHPTGLQLRLMTVLMEDLKTMKELGIKGCRECCFSTGGHYFAAVNGTTVSIYNTYTCENVGNLRGHNGKVRSLCWSPDDTRLISAGMDGAVYEWRLKSWVVLVQDFKRDKENVLKGCNYSSVLATPDCKTLYATGTCPPLAQTTGLHFGAALEKATASSSQGNISTATYGSDRKIKEFEEAPGAGTQITREIDAGVNLTQLTLLPGAKVMMAATEAGGLRTY